MNRRPSEPRAGGWRLRRCFAAALPAVAAATLLAGTGAAPASAATASAPFFSPLAENALTATPSDATLTPGNQYSQFGQYGQVAEFGGFDTCWYNGGAYNGQSAGSVTGCTQDESYPGEYAESQGKFVNPSGFAVDPGDSNAVYVLDRTSANVYTSGSQTSSWRIQKLDDQGNLLGSTTFDLTLPSTNTTDELQMTGLAVDHTNNGGELYALVDDYNGTADVPYEIVAWSITPDTAKQLVAPSGLTQDKTVFTATGAVAADTNALAAGPGIVSSNAQLNGGPLAGAIYNPQGIAVDDQSGGQDELVIEASGTPKQFTTTSNVGKSGTGPTIVQQVATSGSSIGTVGDYWSSATGLFSSTNTLITNDSLSTTAPTPDPNASSTETELGPAGISTNASGGLTVLLDDTHSGSGDSSGAGGTGSYGGVGYNVDVVALGSDLSTEKILASSVNKSGSSGTAYLWTDSQAIDTAGAQPPYAVNSVSPSLTAGPLVVGLSTGLYAANYSGNASSDNAAPADSTGSRDPYYWGDNNAAINPGNYGVRLLNPEQEANGTLSNPTAPLTAVYDTLGNSASGGPCQIADSGSSLAAGADGAIFDLSRGVDSSYASDGPEGVAGRQIIELAPVASDATGACPSPSGTFDVSDPNVNSGAEQAASDSTPLTVKVGDTVTFDGSTVGYPTTSFATRSTTATTATPFAFEWDPGDGGTMTPVTMTGTTLKWPAYTDTYTYNTPGTWEASLQLIGDYGTYDQQGTIVVQAGGLPTAKLTQQTASGTVNQSVTLDGGGSTPYDNTVHIINYHWDCGNGHTFDTTKSTQTCTYTQPNTYTATLTVRDDDQQVSAAAIEQVTIAAPSSTDTNTNTTPTPTTSTPAPTTSTPTPTPTTTTASVTPVVKLSPANDVLKAGVTSTTLTLQVKTLKSGTKLTVKLTEPKVKKAKVKSAKVGAKGVFKFATGKLPAGKTVIRFYETTGKGKKAKLKLVKTETVTVKAKAGKKK